MTEAALAAARAHWGLGAAECTLIAARENAVYRVEGPNGPAALRLHRPGYRTDAELRSELDWMAMLAEGGLTVPNPIPAVNGHTLLKAHGFAIDMLTWLDGAPMSASAVTPQTYHTLGQLTAQMHDLADRWTLPKEFTRPTWTFVDDTPTWDRFWENPALTSPERSVFEAFRHEAQTALEGMKGADRGLIHADLVPDNVLMKGRTLAPIDFDDGGWGFRLFDLATITFSSRRTDPSGVLAEAAIEGYRARRSLDPNPLPFFEALRACTYVGWNITRIAEEGGKARNARFIDNAICAVNRAAG